MSPSQGPQLTINNLDRVAFQAGRQEFNAPVTVNVSDYSSQGDNDLLKRNTVHAALFNSYESYHESLCTADTRIGVRGEIDAFVEQPSNNNEWIFWLSGFVGAGKSTIARTVARKYYDKNRLGASFFFKAGTDAGSARKFFPTIAAQLAELMPSLKPLILDAFRQTVEISGLSPSEQWRLLVSEPLSRLQATGETVLIIVDGLDDCDDIGGTCEIIRLLGATDVLNTTRLRMLLTSRPISRICDSFGKIGHHNRALESIPRSEVNGDIARFLKKEFEVLSSWSFMNAWRGVEEVERLAHNARFEDQAVEILVEKASGVFEWAAIASRFITNGGINGPKRLLRIRDGSKSEATTPPEKRLDEIYLTVLDSIHDGYEYEDDVEFHRAVLGTIVLLVSPLSLGAFAELVGDSPARVYRVVTKLRSIVIIPSHQDEPILLHHPSFRHFLLSSERCTDPRFLVDEQNVHQFLLDRCQRMVHDLQQNICGLKSAGTLISEVNPNLIKKSLPPHVQYACIYWIQHLQRLDSSLVRQEKVSRFLFDDFLHWLEALSLIQSIPEGILALRSLETCINKFDCRNLLGFVDDAHRFVLYHKSNLETAPLQVYCALAFTPAQSVVRTKYRHQIPPWFEQLPNVDQHWDDLRLCVRGHSGSVDSVAFSPDGSKIASVSDNSVVIWNRITAEIVQTIDDFQTELGGATEGSQCRHGRFSPDGTKLVIVFDNNTIGIWNCVTWHVERILEANGPSPVLRRLREAAAFRDLQFLKALSDRPPKEMALKQTVIARYGHYLASLLGEVVTVWNFVTGQAETTFSWWVSWPISMAFRPERNNELVFASFDSSFLHLDVLDVKTMNVLTYDRRKDGMIFHRAVISPQGRVIAAVGRDKGRDAFILWDTCKNKLTVKHTRMSPHRCIIEFSPSGEYVAVECMNRGLLLWNLFTGRNGWICVETSNFIASLAFSVDETELAAGFYDGSLRTWNLVDSKITEEEWHDNYFDIDNLRFSPSGKTLTYSGSTDATAAGDSPLLLWTDFRVKSPRLLDRSVLAHSVVFSRDSYKVAAICDDLTVAKVWDVATGEIEQTIRQKDEFTTLEFLPTGTKLASGTEDGLVRVWCLVSGQVNHEFTTGQVEDESQENRVESLTYSPDSRLLVSGFGDGTITVWRVTTKDLLSTFRAHDCAVTCLAVSSDGSKLASASAFGNVRAWRLDNRGQIERTLDRRHHQGTGPYAPSPDSLAISPDGNTVASASEFYLISWDLSTGHENMLLKAPACDASAPFVHRDSYTVDISNGWIARNQERLLRLPSDYALEAAAIQGNRLAIVTNNGHRVRLISFDSNNVGVLKSSPERQAQIW